MAVRVTQACLIFEIDAPAPVGFTYPLTPPVIAGIGPQSAKFSMVDVVAETASPFTGGQQEQAWPGQWFELEVTLPRLTRVMAEQWLAFLGALHGKLGTFLMGDPLGAIPRGVLGGSPVVSSTNLNGLNQLATRGWTPSIAGILKAGDYIQVTATSAGAQQRLYKVLQDASSDPSGNATLQIFPNIRETLTDGISIITANTAGTFRLSENIRTWDEDKTKTYGISFKAKEAI